MIADIIRYEREAAGGTLTHRLRRDPRRNESHVEISMKDYAPLIRLLLQGEASLLWKHDGRPVVDIPEESQSEQWGFNAARL